MKTVVGFLVAVSFVVGFSSCQKEINWGLNNSTQGDSSFLTKFILLDTTLPAGSDTVQKIFFTYDNAKRLSRIHLYIVGSIDTAIYDFSYTGNETAPHMMINKQTGYNGPGTYFIDSIFYSWNNGIVVKDSSIQWVYPGNTHDATFVRNFILAGTLTKIYEREYVYIGAVFTLINFDSAFYNVSYTSGNLSSQNKVDGAAAFYNSVQATYDTKNNPLTKIIKFRYSCFENYPFNDWGTQKNNPLQVQYQDASLFSGTEQYTYKYRLDDYPASGTYFDSNGLSGYNKILYFYTSL